MATYHFELGLLNPKFVEDETTRDALGRPIRAVNKAGECRMLWVRACEPLPEHIGYVLCSGSIPRCKCCKELHALWVSHNRFFNALVSKADIRGA